MFQKLVAIEPINMNEAARARLYDYAREVVLCADRPADDAEIIRRIGDADAVLVSYTTLVPRAVIEACPRIRYIGMCCSLYSPESANVDICAANERGITVLGIRDYGDEGVVEYVVSELVRLLHGFGAFQWRDVERELTDVKIGIVGLGTSGGMIARALQFFGAEVSYYSRTRKPEREAEGLTYRPLEALLAHVDILITCLNKNTVLLHEAAFARFGNGKILVNTGISPSYDIGALRAWVQNPGNYYLCDTDMAMGDTTLLALPRVISPRKSSGFSSYTIKRLSQKVLENIETYLKGTGELA
nr:NAD(P)-dependent oxidoreductase [Maliibacterium massiliense]